MGKTSSGRVNSRNVWFYDYSTSDKGLITRKTTTESSVLSELTVDEEEEEEKEGDQDDKETIIEEVLPAVPYPIDALARSLPQKQ